MNGPAHHSGADEVDAEVALWRSLFDAHPDPLMYLGCDFRVVRINAAQAKMLGCRVEEAAGRYCYELMHRGDGYVDDCPHARMLKEGGEQTAEYTFEGRDGCYRITVKPFTDPSGRLVGSLHVARDITAHKAMERDLREAHGNLVARVEERTQELNRRLLFDRRLAAMVQRLGPHVLNAGLM